MAMRIRIVRSARARALIHFWTKLDEDWVLNLSGMLAYNYLTATAPLALVALAIAGLALSSISPATLDSYANAIAARLPDGGQQLTHGALHALSHSAGGLLVIAIVTAIFAGSRLFIALENCFCVIYRLRNRPPLLQNAVATGMTLLYAALAPLTFIASGALSALSGLLTFSGAPATGALTYLGRMGAGLLATFILFLAMYVFVPNNGLLRRGGWRDAWRGSWRGALAAAALMTLYEQLFPLYQSLFLRNAGYGSAVGLAIVAIIFLYYAGFITLVGAEVNAWRQGLRPLGVTLPDLYRERAQRVPMVGGPGTLRGRLRAGR